MCRRSGENPQLLASVGIFEASKIYISKDILTVAFSIIVIKYVLRFTFCSCHLCFPTVLASGLDVGSVFEIYVCLIRFCAKVEISAVSTLYWDPFRY